METMTMKTLVFEGAGMEGTGGSVGNCRLRTRLKNKDGRVIYLELGGVETHKHSPRYMAQFKIGGHIDHVFYADRSEDRKKNYSEGLAHLHHKHFEYTKENIIKFVNENLNCDFDKLEVSGSVYVHDTKTMAIC